MEAFRDLTYPPGVGSYDAYAVPRWGFITKMEWKGNRLVASGEIPPPAGSWEAVADNSAPGCRLAASERIKK